MEIYIVVVEDRHSNVGVIPFYNREAAIDRAREIAKGYCSFLEDYEENNYGGFIFHATYSCEGDSVSVSPVVIRGTPE